MEPITTTTLNIANIFHSLDGEINGFSGNGTPSTFIRLAGCNLVCKWCDTTWAQATDSGKEMTIYEILDRIEIPKLTITGGEPLLQLEALIEFIDLVLDTYGSNTPITVETNGTMPIATELLEKPSVRFIVDYKPPSAGITTHTGIFYNLRDVDIIKFCCANHEDYYAAKRAMEVLNARGYNYATFAISPIFDIQWAQELAELFLQDVRSKTIPADTIYSVQLHKILWPTNSTKENER